MSWTYIVYRLSLGFHGLTHLHRTVIGVVGALPQRTYHFQCLDCGYCKPTLWDCRAGHP